MRGALLARGFEDPLDERLEPPVLPDGASAQLLEYGPGQGQAQGDRCPIRQTHRARVAIRFPLEKLSPGEYKLELAIDGTPAGTYPLSIVP